MVQSWTDRLGEIGIWQAAPDASTDLARRVEELGFRTLWLGRSPAGDLHDAAEILDATSSLIVATGIVNVWRSDPVETAAAHRRLVERHPGRFLLGIGIGHPEATRQYASPFETLQSYVATLREHGVPAEEIVLAALGPRVLGLARDMTAGAHPYFVPAEHTWQAREVLGEGPLLAPEHTVVLEPDPVAARELARPFLDRYLGLSNYVRNLRRLGWSEADVTGPSDDLVDAVLAHGEDEAVVMKVRAHLDAGADHVCVQVLVPEGGDMSEAYARLAATALRG
jgi:probable F420-dependent oxidoreductase